MGFTARLPAALVMLVRRALLLLLPLAARAAETYEQGSPVTLYANKVCLRLASE